MRVPEYLLIFLAFVVGMAVGNMYGPTKQIPGVSVVDGQYCKITRDHFLVSGLLSSILDCLAGRFLRVGFVATTIIITISGVLFVTLAQSSDPDSLSYLLGAIVEFIVPFMGIGIIGVAAFVVANTWCCLRNATSSI